MKRKGFTLVELLAVIAILAILVIIAFPNVLKMFNDSKKNSFLTETKTIYSEASKKYITEFMKKNKLTYISSEDDTKLSMTGKELQYCVLLNDDGSVSEMKVSNGTWVATLDKDKKITDLTSEDLTEGNLDDDESCPKSPKSFAEDSWATISNAVKNNNTSKYEVGQTKTVKLNDKDYTVRIANMSTPSDCNTEGFSQSACGFVLEFADIITTHVMNDTATNKGGWPASSMYKFLNDESDSNSIINLLPAELKNVIKDTVTVSGHGSDDTDNFTSTDKLYLLSTAEVWGQGTSNTITVDTARDVTRQLDYYKYYDNIGVTTNNYSGTIKTYNSAESHWWLRSSRSNADNRFYCVYRTGDWDGLVANTVNGVSVAFRIG